MSSGRARVFFDSFVFRVCRFFRGNPDAVLIVGFQILLLACAGLLVAGLGGVAESLAVVAYFLLVGGVLVQLVVYVRGKNGE